MPAKRSVACLVARSDARGQGFILDYFKYSVDEIQQGANVVKSASTLHFLPQFPHSGGTLELIHSPRMFVLLSRSASVRDIQ